METIRFISAKGGDTDTNLCIAGGLIGACVGEKGLEKELLEKLKKSKPSKKTTFHLRIKDLKNININRNK
jgi:ADP-ribosylglycohydrolase